MKTDSWETKMICVLLAWCTILALWCGFQSFQLQRMGQRQLIMGECLLDAQKAILKLLEAEP